MECYALDVSPMAMTFGMRIMNDEPFPGVLSTASLPPIASTRLLQM